MQRAWTTARRPGGAGLPIGYSGFNLTTLAPEWWNGAAWVGAAGVPVAASTPGGILVDNGAGGWVNSAHAAGPANEYVVGPAGGGVAAWQVGIPAADVVNPGAPGQSVIIPGVCVAHAGFAGPGWVATANSAFLNGALPLPVGGWLEKA